MISINQNAPHIPQTPTECPSVSSEVKPDESVFPPEPDTVDNTPDIKDDSADIIATINEEAESTHDCLPSHSIGEPDMGSQGAQSSSGIDRPDMDEPKYFKEDGEPDESMDSQEPKPGLKEDENNKDNGFISKFFKGFLNGIFHGAVHPENENPNKYE